MQQDSPLNDTADGDDSDNAEEDNEENAEEDNEENVEVALMVLLHCHFTSKTDTSTELPPWENPDCPRCC